MMSGRRFVAACVAVIGVLFAAGCVPGAPPPVVGTPPFSGVSQAAANGTQVATVVGCAPAGAEVTARILPLGDPEGSFNSFALEVSDLDPLDGVDEVPFQRVEEGAPTGEFTISAEPLSTGACIRVNVQSGRFFDLSARSFSYVITW